MTQLWALFLSFLQIGFLSIGGGYATLPLIQIEIVDGRQWLSLQEFTDIVTISQMTPGPLAVNSATFVGLRVSGIMGAVIATFACVISGCLISLMLERFFRRNQENQLIQTAFSGLQASAVGLIAGASLSMLTLAFAGTLNWNEVQTVEWLPVLLSTGYLVFLRKMKISPILLLVIAGVIGFFIY
ncbi:chromate transporter [uncultured Enterococcus sp.]|uniref:chromate transporter n=1 Tax=uncultured Enterococcus sp. TaxID=167972 RepID=UPI002AA6F1BA|nr:chromate transporter [uncultured Enterococcus sp.]